MFSMKLMRILSIVPVLFASKTEEYTRANPSNASSRSQTETSGPDSKSDGSEARDKSLISKNELHDLETEIKKVTVLFNSDQPESKKGASNEKQCRLS